MHPAPAGIMDHPSSSSTAMMFESGMSGGGTGDHDIDEEDPDAYLIDRSTLAKGEAGHTMTLLPEDFVPGDNDVICGRGRKIFMHPGNERFRLMVSECLEEYSNTVTKLEKSYILCDIVAQVRANAPNGGFVKKDSKDGRWYEVGDFLAREKTSQAFRDALHEQYKSSNTAKKIRRQAEGTTKMPRRAFSTSQLDSKILGEKAKVRDGYSDPLLAKLRHQKSARSVFEFTENGAARAAGGAASGVGGGGGLLAMKPSAATGLMRASCPNLARSRASTGTIPSHFGGRIGGGGGGAGSRNFDWGAPPSRESNNSTANFELRAAQESKDSSLSGAANFDWGFPKTSSTPLQRINEVGKVNLFSKFTSLSPVDGMQQHQQRRSSLDMDTLQSLDPNFDLCDLVEPIGNGSSSSFLLGAMASPNGGRGVGATQALTQSQSNALLHHAQNLLPTPLLSGPSPSVNSSSSSAAMDIEAKLRALRKSTFESSSSAAVAAPVPLPELLEDPLGDATMMDLLGNDDVGDSTFDKLAELVGDVDSLGDDPFEPAPLP